MSEDRCDFYVYLHHRLTDGRVFYVGKGTGPRAWVWQNRNPYWTNTKAKHGLEVEIAICGLSEDEAFAHEKRLIAKFLNEGHPLTNLTAGGEGMSGYVFTEQHKKRLSEAGKGRKRSKEAIEKWKNTRSGWKHSEETKAKISAILSGRVVGPHSEETRAKISASNTGKRPSAETKLKISKNRSGILSKPEHVAKRVKSRMEAGYTHSEQTRAKIGAANAKALKGKPMLDHVKDILLFANTKQEPVLCVETGRVFETATDARDWCISQGYKHATSGRIRRVCNGHGKTCYKKTWKFVKDAKECKPS